MEGLIHGGAYFRNFTVCQILVQPYQRSLTCLNTDVPACRCHCSNIFAMAQEISKINNFSIFKKLKTCAPCDYLLFRKNSTTIVTPVVDPLGAKTVLRDARLGESAEKNVCSVGMW